MKKSTYVTIIAVLAALLGALAAVAVYLKRRERELAGYEELLFSEEFNDEFDDEANEELAQTEPEA